jgi:hypothetical protein
MVRLCTRRIEADPLDAYAYSDRARYYDYLRDRANANADMRRWSAVMGGGIASDLQLATPRNFRRVINIPFDCQIVFSAERPVNEIPVMSVAFGQKGRWEMKLFEIPMVATSLLGLCLVSGLGVPPAHADFTFGMPTNLGPSFNTSALDYLARLSDDELALVFMHTTGELLIAKRATTDDPWGIPVICGDLSDAAFVSVKAWANLTTADGLELYAWPTQPDGYGGSDIYFMKRATTTDNWGPWANLGPTVNSAGDEMGTAVSPDGLELYFSGFMSGVLRPGGYGGSDIWMTKRTTRNDPWGVPVNLGPTVNSPFDDMMPYLSADRLVLLFASNRPAGYGHLDLYVTRRATLSSPWGKAINLGPMINSPQDEEWPSLSPDSSTLYWDSDRPGGYGNNDIWQAPILPIVDFNADGKVDGKEVLAMAEHWGQNKSLYDIGLSPMGDGVVDTKDLTVLAGYIGQDVNDPTLIAHWALDETPGMTAADSAGDNDAMVLGNAAWRSDGKIGGALAFDGKDDFARSGKSVLDPAQGPFSVIAWVKGGAPNRVIVSQFGGADWLYLNQFGMLTTDLTAPGRDGKPLTSDAYALDDQWHRVVLVWDGTNRTLQMDGAEVARDTQPNLAVSTGSLQIGGGKNLATSTLWTGLMDDVRVYNRAVAP